MLSRVFLIFGGEAIVRRKPVDLAIAQEDLRIFRLAQSPRGLDERAEHSLQIESRAANHLQHVGGSGLLAEQFAQCAFEIGYLTLRVGRLLRWSRSCFALRPFGLRYHGLTWRRIAARHAALAITVPQSHGVPRAPASRRSSATANVLCAPRWRTEE
jgi:hypothetical protein